MWLVLLICYCLYSLSSSTSWYPVYPILGEQIDLVGTLNESFARNWTKSIENDEAKDVFDSDDAFNSTQIPFNSIDRDREPLDEVERIDPRNWPVRPDIFYTRTIPSTTEVSLPRNPLYPSTSAQRNSSTQR